MCDRAEDDGKRLSCSGNLAESVSRQGKHAEAEKMEREVLSRASDVGCCGQSGCMPQEPREVR